MLARLRLPQLVEVVAITVLLLGTTSSVGAVAVYSDQAAFLAFTGATNVPIPNAATAFPGTTCGGGDVGPTGAGPSVTMPFGANGVTVTGAASNGLCIFDDGTIIKSANTNPNVMIANTIVGNGEDDFLLTFDAPVWAIGLRLLTNNHADELVTLRDAAGAVIGVVDIDALTPTNARPFVGFVSSAPFKSVVLDTANGAVENEGFDMLLIGENPVSVPEPPFLSHIALGLIGLAAWRLCRSRSA